MSSFDFRSSLSLYNPPNAQEASFKTQMLDLFSEGKIAFERKREAGHFTASAWVLDPHSKSVLLILHSKINKWLQPGGHADGNQDLLEVAKKELMEETGVNGVELIKTTIFDLDIHTISAHKGIPEHLHYDLRFIFRGNSNASLEINHESKDIQWVPLDEIPDLVGNDDSICRMVEKSKELLK
jgi:8-oxo-dGTP pyrophosphatase MutT (NUDIX family)